MDEPDLCQVRVRFLPGIILGLPMHLELVRANVRRKENKHNDVTVLSLPNVYCIYPPHQLLTLKERRPLVLCARE